MDRLKDRYRYLLENLDAASTWLTPLLFRLILAQACWAAGEKLPGAFSFPFTLLPPDLLWNFRAGFAIVATLALIAGFGARFFALALLLAGALGGAPALLYLALCLALILSGPGKLSVDYWLRQRYLKTQRRLWS
jgi:putative oxidoreductase